MTTHFYDFERLSEKTISYHSTLELVRKNQILYEKLSIAKYM